MVKVAVAWEAATRGLVFSWNREPDREHPIETTNITICFVRSDTAKIVESIQAPSVARKASQDNDDTSNCRQSDDGGKQEDQEACFPRAFDISIDLGFPQVCP